MDLHAILRDAQHRFAQPKKPGLMKNPQKRSFHYWWHRVFAHPFHITWVVGTIGLWVPLTMHFHRAGVFIFLTTEWSTIPLLALCYAATSGLGFYAAIFTVGWLIVAVSRRLNGAPHEVGESVLVLSGSHAGRSSTVYGIAKGQGGQPLPRVELGTEAKEKSLDVFDQYQLLRMSPRPSP